MTGAERLDAYQRRHPRASFPLAVIYKYVDDQGGYLAALITYYGLVSLLPLLLLLSTILGLVLAGDPSAQHQILNSALSQFPFIGAKLQTPRELSGGVTGIVIGGLGAIYGGLGVAQAVQNAMNSAWSVPRNSRPNPFRVRGRSALLLSTVGIGLLITGGLAVIAVGAGPFGWLLRALVTVVTVVANAGLFIIGFRLSTARALTVREVAPGAITAALLWQLLQSFGATFVTHVVRHASDTNAVFAVVLGFIAFAYVASVALMFCVEINVVLVDRLYPRSLLTPFTDAVKLTRGDRRAYTSRAKAQRAKGFQEVEVTYHPPE